jgi:hypothetical protein
MICRRDLGRRHSFWPVSAAASPCEQQQYFRSQLPATSENQEERGGRPTGTAQFNLQLQRQQARFAHPSSPTDIYVYLEFMCAEGGREGGRENLRERNDEGRRDWAIPLSSFLFGLREREEREGVWGQARQSKAILASSSAFICCGGLVCVCGSSNMLGRERERGEMPWLLQWVGGRYTPTLHISVYLANMYSLTTKINAYLRGQNAKLIKNTIIYDT